MNQSTISAFDGLNRLIQVTDPGSGQTRFVHDGQDRLVQVIDPRNLATTYTVDGLGNQTQQSSPDTGITTTAVDAAGNVLSKTDAKGQTTAYQYDALNRLTQVSHADGSQIRYTWDQGANGIGRLSKIEELQNGTVTGNLTLAYDNQGRVANETRTVGALRHSLSYLWQGGQLVAMTTPSGKQVSYTRNAAGQVAQVNLLDPVGGNKILAQGIVYHPFGGIKSYLDGAGQTIHRPADPDGRTSGFTLGTQNWLLTYDVLGRITGQMDTSNAAHSASYTYDRMDRLTGAVLPNTNYGYSYDPTGNRTSQTSGSNTRGYSIDPVSNKLLGLTNPAQTVHYDANGSIINDGANQYAYDARGRLTQTDTAAGTTRYRINALGQRVKKTNDATEVYYHYDPAGHLIAESDATGKIIKEYFWLGDTPIAVMQ